MSSLLLALLFFLQLSLVGGATFALLGLRFGRVRTWLFAPVMGLSVTAIFVMVLNQAGIPVGVFARPLVIAMAGAAIAVLAWRRPAKPRGLGMFLLIALGALALGGWPALKFGFNWVGYGNDDMTNYCLGAERFLRHGFYAIPTPADLAGGDYSNYFWMMHVVGMIRFGAEHVVALAAGVTGLTTVQVFMTTILALSLVQLFAVLGLAYARPSRRGLALGAGLLLVAAPLWYCGTMYQLIAQVAGLGLLAVVFALTARTRFPKGVAARLRLSAGYALLITGLGLFYPEVIPFLVLGWGFFMGWKLVQTRRWPAGLIPVVAMSLVGVFLLMRHNVISTAITLLAQAQEGMDAQSTAARVSLFPYFLVPAGPAYLFGFDVIVAAFTGARGVVGLLAGFAAGAVALYACWQGVRRSSLAAMMLAVMAVIGARLFFSGNGFGLFKLCMFALPFLAVELARFARDLRRPLVVATCMVVLSCAWLPGAWRYAAAGNPGSVSGVRELFDASRSRGNLPADATAQPWALTMTSPVCKLLMLESRGTAPAFLSQIINASILGRAEKPYPDWIWRLLPGEGDGAAARRVLGYIKNEVYRTETLHGLNFWSRAATREPAPAATSLEVVTSSAELRSFNKLHPGDFPVSEGLFSFTTLDRLRNHAVFIQSAEGQHYYLGATGRIAVYKPQPDLYRPNDYFFMIGRHLLFRVLNPSAQVRVRLSLTASILGDGQVALPHHATVAGAASDPVSLGLVGGGSANIFSAPLPLAELGGAHYFALDLGEPSRPIGKAGTGLRGWYNAGISLDTRIGLGYCRDISVISEADYQARPARSGIAKFPADLLAPDAPEYSGLFEDGWVSRAAFVKLGPAQRGGKLTLRGSIPEIAGRSSDPIRCEIRVDGKLLIVRELTPGAFVLEATLLETTPLARIDLFFDHAEALPAPDNRPVTVLMDSLLLTPAS